MEVCRTNSMENSSVNGSHTRFVCLHEFRQNWRVKNPSFLLLLCHWPNNTSKLYHLSFFKSWIFLWQVIAYVKGFVHRLILNVYKLNKMTGTERFNPPGSMSPLLLDAFCSNLDMKQNGIFAALFSEFCQDTQNQGLNRI